MTLYPRLLFDANMLQDLKLLGLLKVCIDAVACPCTLDLIRNDEMQTLPWEYVDSLGMRSLELVSEKMDEALALKQKFSKLSMPYDACLVVLAKEKDIPVFTEDDEMVKAMKDQNVQHVSLLEMVYSLADAKKISSEETVSAFLRIFTELKQGIEEKYPEILEKILEKYPEILEKILEKYPEILKKILENILEKYPEILKKILEKYPEIREKILGKYPEIREKIPKNYR